MKKIIFVFAAILVFITSNIYGQNIIGINSAGKNIYKEAYSAGCFHWGETYGTKVTCPCPTAAQQATYKANQQQNQNQYQYTNTNAPVAEYDRYDGEKISKASDGTCSYSGAIQWYVEPNSTKKRSENYGWNTKYTKTICSCPGTPEYEAEKKKYEEIKNILNSSKVILYSDSDYSGENKTFSLSSADGNSFHSMGKFALKNDDISSIKVGAGLKVTLYWDTNLGGKSTSFTNDVSHLSAHSWNDQASSFTIKLQDQYKIKK